MEIIAREKFIECLTQQWLPLVARYQRLSAQEQKAFLTRQGYATLSGLLGHIVAWWQDGARVVEEMRSNAAMPLADYNVDEFNDRAVARFGALDDAAAIREYETQRQIMLKLVCDLSEDEISRVNINTRLYYEILMHWTEHTLE